MNRRRRKDRQYQLQRYVYRPEQAKRRKRRRLGAAAAIIAAALLGIAATAAIGRSLLKAEDGDNTDKLLESAFASSDGGDGKQTSAEDGDTSEETDRYPKEDGGTGETEDNANAPSQAEASKETESPGTKKDKPDIDTRPKVKGIYVTGPKAGSEGFRDLLTLVDETELNTMVIDIKNDEGNITYDMPLESVQATGACVKYIRDMEGLMSTLKEHNVYTIARIICFKDPCLAKSRPELALKKPDGTPVTDAYGLAWVNPYEKGVWEYLAGIAGAAADIGFDEIQFDYVRFPIGEDAEQAVYGVDMEAYPKQQAIVDFLSYVSEELGDRNIPVTADVFGTIIGSETDVKQVGQDYVQLGETADILCPMVYPSHYSGGVFGLKVPDAQPYETVLAALTASGEELAALPEEKRAVVRPWLQAFTASWVQGHISYGGEQIRQQIQAVYDAGYEEWLLWNATNRYSADGLLPAEDTPSHPTASQPLCP